ncbi:MAG: type VI secretion system ATPase TssH, partial [Thermomicrobiales bacterium]
IIFHQLTRDEIQEIVDIQLETINRRLAERRMTVQLTTAARDLIATLGYDPVFGARPLKRVIQKQILDPLAMKLLSGDLHEGETIVIDVGEDGELAFHGTMSHAPMAA